MKKKITIFLVTIIAPLLCCASADAGEDIYLLSMFGNYTIPADSDYDGNFAGGARVGTAFCEGPCLGYELVYDLFTLDAKKHDNTDTNNDDLLIKSLGLNIFLGHMLSFCCFTDNNVDKISLGIGHYEFDNGSKGAGLNVGLGALIPIWRRQKKGLSPLELDVSINYHHIFNNSKGTNLFEVRTGLDILFF